MPAHPEGREPPPARAQSPGLLAALYDTLRALTIIVDGLPVDLEADALALALAAGLRALATMAQAWGSPLAQAVARRCAVLAAPPSHPVDRPLLAARLAASPAPVVVGLAQEANGQTTLHGPMDLYREGVRPIFGMWSDDPAVLADRLTLSANPPAEERAAAPAALSSPLTERQRWAALLVNIEGAMHEARTAGQDLWSTALDLSKSEEDQAFSGHVDSANAFAFDLHAAVRIVDLYIAEGRAILDAGEVAEVRAMATSRGEAPPAPLTAADLRDLRQTMEDAFAAGLDATAPPGRRSLGRRVARRTIIEAARKARQTLDIAEGHAHA